MLEKARQDFQPMLRYSSQLKPHTAPLASSSSLLHIYNIQTPKHAHKPSSSHYILTSRSHINKHHIPKHSHKPSPPSLSPPLLYHSISSIHTNNPPSLLSPPLICTLTLTHPIPSPYHHHPGISNSETHTSKSTDISPILLGFPTTTGMEYDQQ